MLLDYWCLNLVEQRPGHALAYSVVNGFTWFIDLIGAATRKQTNNYLTLAELKLPQLHSSCATELTLCVHSCPRSAAYYSCLHICFGSSTFVSVGQAGLTITIKFFV